MKKLILFLAILMLLVGTVACNNEQNRGDSTTEKSPNGDLNGETEETNEFNKEIATSILKEYEKRFASIMNDAGENNKIQSYKSKVDIKAYFLEIMSEEWADWLTDAYITEKQDGLYVVAMDAPTWLEEDQPFLIEKDNNNHNHYKLIQERNNELLGHINYVAYFIKRDEKWILEKIDIESLEVASTDHGETDVKNKAQEIINALANNDTKKLAEYVHSTKGLLFSPYVYVEEGAVVFDKNKVENMLESSTEYNWGTMDGSEEPIELTPKDYYSRFVYSNSFTDADQVLIDKDMKRGNTINNIKEVFPDSKVVEFYINGSEEYEGMDWQSLNVVFQKDEDGIWKLVALVHDEWTI